MRDFVSDGLWDYTKSAGSQAGMWAEGVLSGFLLMLVPLLLIGAAVGISLFVVKAPVRALGGA